MIKVWLDGTEVSCPIDWDGLTSVLKRDDTFNSVLFYQEGTLTFDGDGYTYLTGLIETNGFCGSVQIDIFDHSIESNPVQIVKGTIFLSDISIDEYNLTAQCKIEDSSFYAMINNNKNIKCTVSSPYSKNQEDITAATNYLLKLYEPPSNSTHWEIASVRVYEAFRVLVAFMSDNRISFVSDTFNLDGEWEGLTITSGEKIRKRDGSEATLDIGLPSFSFTELFNEVNKRIPIGMIIENPTTNPTIRIEVLTYFYEQYATYEFSDVEKITTNFDTEKLYSVVKLGTANTDTSVGLSFPEDIRFRGFKEEEYHVLGECNIDKTLDLQCDWTTSSNVIEATFSASDDTYDKDLYLINSIPVSDVYGESTATNYLGLATPKYYANEALTNAAVAERYLRGVPNSIAAFFGTIGDGLFKAYLSADQTYANTGNDIYLPTGFDVIDYNTGSYYDNATFKFTATEAGIFAFKSEIVIDITAQSSAPVTYWQLLFRRYDASNTLLESKEGFFGNFTSSLGINYYSNSIIGVFTLGGREQQFIMNENDYVVVELNKSAFPSGDITYTIKGSPSTYFSCVDNTVGGGVFQIYDPFAYPIQQHLFEYNQTLDDWNTILANPTASYKFYNSPENVRFAWIKELRYNHYKGLTQVKLITNKNTQSNGNRINT